MRHLAFLAACLVAGAAQAEGFALRATDVVLDDAGLGLLADGARLTYFDDGVALFSAGGAYSYTYANDGGTAFGRFRVGDGGQICIDFRNGAARCDVYVRNAGRLTLLTEDGRRFPVKAEEGAGP